MTEAIDIDQRLTFLPEYGVLICKTCQFAVQPNALSRHLLRHQIYRKTRKKLLDQLAELKIRDPESVLVPSLDSPPLPNLPVYQGHKCRASGCRFTCVSLKRMNLHWSEKHNEPHSEKVEADPVYLQTFFRGNRIRYFEVSAGADGTLVTNIYEQGAVSTKARQASGSSEEPEGETDLDMSDKLSETPDVTSEQSLYRTPHIDMPSLRLIHHYTTVTAHTLSRGNEPFDFWPTVLTQHAFEHDFLMHGILGVTASHLATLSSPPQNSESWRQVALSHHAACLTGFRTAIPQSNPRQATALIACSRLLGIQHCIQFRLKAPRRRYLSPSSSSAYSSHDSTGKVSDLLEFFVLIRGGSEILVALQNQLPQGSPFLLGREDAKNLQYMGPEEVLAAAPHVDLDSHTKDLLLSLSETMPYILQPHERLPPPTELDQAAVGTAAAAIVVSYSRAVSLDSPVVSWTGLETWPRLVTPHFVRMMEQGHPLTLVHFALWSKMVERLAPHYWFLEGQTERLQSIVRAEVSEDVKVLLGKLMEGVILEK